MREKIRSLSSNKLNIFAISFSLYTFLRDMQELITGFKSNLLLFSFSALVLIILLMFNFVNNKQFDKEISLDKRMESEIEKNSISVADQNKDSDSTHDTSKYRIQASRSNIPELSVENYKVFEEVNNKNFIEEPLEGYDNIIDKKVGNVVVSRSSLQQKKISFRSENIKNDKKLIVHKWYNVFCFNPLINKIIFATLLYILIMIIGSLFY